jgi:hypothetical protein
MNLSEIRQALATLSGRFDLFDEVIDVGDMLINEAVKALDRLSETQKTWASHLVYVASGGWYAELPYCRAIKEVWVSDDTGERWQLEKKNIQDLMAGWMTELAANTEGGAPLYYSPAVTRRIPEGGALPVNVTNYIDINTSSGYIYNSIIVAPVTDAQYLLDIRGLFGSKKLTLEVDENYWSVNHPGLLIKATLREIEVFNRNASGVRDFDTAIATDLDGINKDLVEEIIAEVDQMEG